MTSENHYSDACPCTTCNALKRAKKKSETEKIVSWWQMLRLRLAYLLTPKEFKRDYIGMVISSVTTRVIAQAIKESANEVLNGKK